MKPVHYHLGGFPPPPLDWQNLLPLVGPANRAIARYAGLLQGVQNPNVLLSPLTVQEAVLSSRIEGTQATMGEVLELEAQGGPPDESTPKKADIFEVLNYRSALNEAAHLLDELPLSQRLIRETHRVLMQGVRGRQKDPGEYRRIPNWIGREGCSVEEAKYVPIAADRLPDAMDKWERYVNSNVEDDLIQLAVVHAEFEAIHPFLDGNGRLGRLIVPLFMYSRGLLSRPNFYLSEYLEYNRDEYYARLLEISQNGNWTDWCAFFLRAIIAQAEVNQKRAQDIIDLYREKKDWIVAETHSQHAVRALDWMFQRPIFKSSDFASTAGIPAPTATRILRVVRGRGLLRDLRPSRGRSAAILCFPELLNIAEGRAAF